MAIILDDYKRCECGSNHFKEISVVTIPIEQRKRDDFHLHEPVSNTGKEIIYVCTECGSKLDV